MGIKKVFHNALFEKVSIAPLVTFRILFGALMFASVMRFGSMAGLKLNSSNQSCILNILGFTGYQSPVLLAIIRFSY